MAEEQDKRLLAPEEITDYDEMTKRFRHLVGWGYQVTVYLDKELGKYKLEAAQLAKIKDKVDKPN